MLDLPVTDIVRRVKLVSVRHKRGQVGQRYSLMDGLWCNPIGNLQRVSLCVDSSVAPCREHHEHTGAVTSLSCTTVSPFAIHTHLSSASAGVGAWPRVNAPLTTRRPNTSTATALFFHQVSRLSWKNTEDDRLPSCTLAPTPPFSFFFFSLYRLLQLHMLLSSIP